MARKHAKALFKTFLFYVDTDLVSLTRVGLFLSFLNFLLLPFVLFLVDLKTGVYQSTCLASLPPGPTLLPERPISTIRIGWGKFCSMEPQTFINGLWCNWQNTLAA